MKDEYFAFTQRECKFLTMINNKRRGGVINCSTILTLRYAMQMQMPLTLSLIQIHNSAAWRINWIKQSLLDKLIKSLSPTTNNSDDNMMTMLTNWICNVKL